VENAGACADRKAKRFTFQGRFCLSGYSIELCVAPSARNSAFS
jgi:hypothetical protein